MKFFLLAIAVVCMTVGCYSTRKVPATFTCPICHRQANLDGVYPNLTFYRCPSRHLISTDRDGELFTAR